MNIDFTSFFFGFISAIALIACTALYYSFKFRVQVPTEKQPIPKPKFAFTSEINKLKQEMEAKKGEFPEDEYKDLAEKLIIARKNLLELNNTEPGALASMEIDFQDAWDEASREYGELYYKMFQKAPSDW